ncbi:hypothetical protein CRENBAI_022875 [Crenichthys baileyi]|uniref:Uncharacterized protein n=1 Tax=Crenichthys baileyi TaxID=28760 RepID=A0AAV9RCE3_9TELE
MISHVMPDHVSGVLAGSFRDRSPSFLLFRSSGQVESTLTTPAIFLLSLAEITLLPPQLLPPRHLAQLLQWFSSDLSVSPQASTSYSTPTIFPASLISSMDSFQRSKSSLTQLLRELATNSATSALPLLRSADAQLPLTFTLTALVLVRL